ncbi:HYR-like domain-containing protein [Halocola ammonii]
MKNISTLFVSILLLSGFYANKALGTAPPLFGFDDQLCDNEDCYVSGYGESERAIWLTDLPNGIHEDFMFDENGGSFETFPNGTAHLSGTVVNMEDPDYAFEMSVWFKNRMNWEEWSDLGRGWKGNPDIVGNLYQTWDYFIMDPDSANELIGINALDGSYISLTHRPSNYHYGLQIGEAANDKNAEPGMSVWFDYSGQVDGEYIIGHGDANLEGGCENLPVLDCVDDVSIECDQDTAPDFTGEPELNCPESYTLTYEDQIVETDCGYTIIRVWTATHVVSSEEVVCEQHITVEDTEAPVVDMSLLNASGCSINSEAIAAAVVDNCDENPTVEVQVLESESTSGDFCDPGMFRTQTMGGWGANPNGNNPGVYLENNFDAAFPNGITIGCENTITFTSAQAIRDFLPSGSSPSPLPEGNMTNPGGSYNNVFAGQVLALSISAGFDQAIEDFGDAPITILDLEVASGDLAGVSVSELLQEANNVLGGCESEYSITQLNTAITSINENFVDGTQSNGYLDCDLEGECVQLVNVQVYATDECGNTLDEIFQLTISDDEAPVFVSAPDDISVPCGEIPEPIYEIEDNCSSAEVVVEVADELVSGACLNTIQRTFTATDACGNVTTHVQYIQQIDEEAPVFQNEPENLTILCGEEIPSFEPTVTDNCLEDLPVEFSEEIQTSNCQQVITQTWTAIDNCSNTSSVSRQIIVVDTTGPVAEAGVEELTVECGSLEEAPELSFSDDCSEIASVTFEDEVEEDGCAQLISRVYTATDNCGNTTVVTQIIEVIDQAPPQFISVPADVETLCGAVPQINDPIVIDNCSEVEISLTVSYPETENCNEIVRTWTATDACGNSSFATQTIVQIDNEAPVFTDVPEDITAACGDPVEFLEPTATDNCPTSLEVVYEEESTAADCAVITTRTWIATDGCGNTAVATQTITQTDNEEPVFDAPSEISVECNSIPTEANINVSDDCAEQLDVSYSDSVIDGVCSYSFVRTWTAIDVCGNTAVFEQTINVVDESAPEFVYVPITKSVPCGVSPLLESPEVVDNCSDIEIEFSEEITGEGCNQQMIRTWIATDACGNSSEATQVINFIDNQGPTFSASVSDLELSCEEEVPAAVDLTATDNCSGVVEVVFFEEMTQLCGSTYTIERTWTATDDCGNSSVESQTIEVIDDVAPVFEFVPEDVEVACGSIPEVSTLNATDNCGGEVTIEFDTESPTGGCPNIQRIWTATDACGNATSVIQNVFITDTEAPTFVDFPDDIEVDCNSLPEMPDPDAVDNCDENVVVTATQSIIGSGCQYTIIRTWIASDACGNSTVRSQSVTVNDTEAPVFAESPEDITVECSSDLAPTYPEVVDDCAGNIQVTHEDEVLGSGCEYQILRTFTAMDDCGNTATEDQIITVVDNSAPFLQGIPANAYVDCNNIPEPAEVTAVDACSQDLEVTLTEETFGEGCEYVISRTYYAEDDCGNGISITTLVHVSDESAPVFSGLEPEVNVDCDEVMPELGEPTVTDNCTENPTVNYMTFSESVECGGEIITRIWTATDDCGNTSTFTQVVNRTDTTAPVMTNVPSNTIAECGSLPAIEYPDATDNCTDQVEITVIQEVIPGECPYEVQRIFRAFDECGNMSMAVQSIFVHDTQAPEFTSELPQDTTVNCGEVPGPAEVTAVDNCSVVEIIFSEETVIEDCGKTLIRTWTASDDCDNSTMHTQVITLEDNASPQFEYQPQPLTVECSEVPAFDSIPVWDDCGNVTITLEELVTETECSSEYELFRIWTATDNCGNQASVAQEISVVDNTAPVITNLPEDTIADCHNVPEVPELIVDEGCGNENVDIQLEETISGDTESDNCELGNAVTLSNEVALLLPGVEGMSEYFVFAEEGGLLERDPQTGTAHITGQVYDVANGNKSWIIDIHLENQMNWEEWSALGRSYKDDADVAGDSYLDWSFYTVDPDQSQLVGAGDFSGSTLSLSHAPLDFMYGFQLGWAANNRNAEYGMSGWFMYDGEVNGTQIEGMGDIIVENNCCPDHEIVRTWTITDCAGNQTVHVQTITVTSTFEPGTINMPFIAEEPNFSVTGSEGEEFNLRYYVPESGKVNISMYDLSGNHLKTIFDGYLEEGQEYTTKVNKTSFTSGIYLFRMVYGSESISDKEIVTR